MEKLIKCVELNNPIITSLVRYSKISVKILLGLTLSFGARASVPVLEPNGIYNVNLSDATYARSLDFKLQTKQADPGTLRIYAIYTENAIADSGGIPFVDQYLDDQVNRANLTFADSGLDITVVVAQRDRLSEFQASSPLSQENLSNGLSHLRSNLPELIAYSPTIPAGPATGKMVDAFADIALLVTSGKSELENTVTPLCGLATQNTNSSLLSTELKTTTLLNFIAIATDVQGLACNSIPVFAHEIGHVMGSGHHWDSTSVGFVSGSYLDAYGTNCGGSNTLMSVGATSQNEEFVSDPTIMRSGEACGIIDQANNNRVFDFTAPLVAGKIGDYVSIGSVSLSTDSNTLEEGDSSTITIARTGDITSSYSLEVAIRPEGMDLSDFSTGVKFIQTISFLANESSKSLTFTVEDDSEVEETSTFEVYLRNSSVYVVEDGSVTVNVTDNDSSPPPPPPVTPPPTSSGGGGGSAGFIFFLLAFIRYKNKF